MTAQLHSEAKLKLGIMVAGFGLGAIDYLRDSITLDDTAAALFDFPVDTPIGRDHLHSRFHPDCARELATKIQTVLDPTGAGFLAAEHQIVRPDGSGLWIVARKQVEFGVDPSTGQRRAVSGLLAVRDITSRKVVEEELRISELRYRRLFEAAHDGVLLIDPLTSRIVDANPFMTWLLGYSHDQLVGKELFQIGLLRDSAMSQDMVRRLKTDLHVRYEDLPLVSDTGQHRDVEVVANLYDEGGHAIIQCNIRDITTRKKAAQQIQQLMGEVNHRAMNLLGVVQAVARQTARVGDPVTFVTRLTERIDSLAASQELLVKNEWEGVDVADLVTAQLMHYKDLFGTRVIVNGPTARLTPRAAQGIGMALHELATNAGKYGALSTSAGHVHISWLINAAMASMFEMRWIETGGPPVEPPVRKGFGQKVIGTMAEASVNGTAEVDYRPTGIVWTLIAPISDTLERGRPEPPASHAQR